MLTGLTLSSVIVTLVIAFYFRNVIRSVADATEDAILDMTEATRDQVSGYAVTMARDAIVDNQEAITELKALLADPDIVRPSDFLREQRQQRKNRKTNRKTNQQTN